MKNDPEIDHTFALRARPRARGALGSTYLLTARDDLERRDLLSPDPRTAPPCRRSWAPVLVDRLLRRGAHHDQADGIGRSLTRHRRVRIPATQAAQVRLGI